MKERLCNQWRPICLWVLWAAGVMVVAARVSGGEPTYHIIGYVGGLLVATYVLLNVMRPDAALRDWAMLLGLVLLTISGWLKDVEPEATTAFSMEVAAIVILLVMTVSLLGAVAAADKLLDRGFKIMDYWLISRFHRKRRSPPESVDNPASRPR